MPMPANRQRDCLAPATPSTRLFQCLRSARSQGAGHALAPRRATQHTSRWSLLLWSSQWAGGHTCSKSSTQPCLQGSWPLWSTSEMQVVSPVRCRHGRAVTPAQTPGLASLAPVLQWPSRTSTGTGESVPPRGGVASRASRCMVHAHEGGSRMKGTRTFVNLEPSLSVLH